jgi:sigma-B regulation protein RsbU (phosphoserine phosphatase)
MTERVQVLVAELTDKQKLEAELEIAREVQSQLFPRIVPRLRTLEVAGRCVPARSVSGDYYDFVPCGHRWTALAIGDISGKGISAALLMASVQSAFHSQLRFAGECKSESAVLFGLSASEIVDQLNRHLYESTSAEKYATFYCGIYDDEHGHLTYANAGHVPPLVIRGGKAIRLAVTGAVVGMFAESIYEQQVIELQKGDLLAAFTDGITECENSSGESFGDDRLIELLLRHSELPLEEMTERIFGHLRDWRHGLETQDDTTMLLARRI